jgi:ABC-type proline/glycine betaine transport system ATPase subunit
MSVVQKLGVLRKNTVIHTEDLDFKVERGTIVFVSEDTLRFRDKSLTAYRKGEVFFVRSEFSPVPHRAVFPDGGVPYPFTML